MVNPGKSGASERIRIHPENGMILQSQLPGAQMPPQVGVSGRARGQPQKAQGNYGNKDSSRLAVLLPSRKL